MKIATKITFAAFLIGLAACGGGGDDSGNKEVTICPRVINGETCEESGSPIVELNIITNKGKTSLCSGTVVSPTKVLTAAHCFLSISVNSVIVNAGGTFHEAVAYSIHPNVAVSSNAIINDVAIVQTETAINAPTLPILLGTTPQIGDMIGINGYGLDESDNLGVLRGGKMKITNVTTNHVIAAYTGELSNTCNGDSGGPATYTKNGKVAVIGITSSGIKTDCSAGDETLFTNIQSRSILDYLADVAPEIGVL